MKINAKKLVSTKNMTREDWLIWRQSGLGGSDISGLLGLNKWTTPFQVYISKVEKIEENDETSEAAEWGNELEPVIRKKFKEKHPELRVQQSHFMWQHPKHSFMLANVDGFLYDQEKGWGVLEIKTSSEYRLKEWNGEEVPEEYLLQAQHYLAVLGLNWGWFAVLIGGNKYREFYFERDNELIETLITLEHDFWNNNVMAKVPPELDGSDACVNLVKDMFPAQKAKDKGEVIDLPSEAGKLLDVLDTTKEKLKELETQKKEAENKLKQLIGEYQKGLFNNRKISWSTIAKTDFDKKKFEQENPDLYKKYLRSSSYRRFMA